MLDALRFTTDVRSILQRNRIVNNFGHYWPHKIWATKKNEVYLGYQLSSSKTSNPAIGWQHNNTPYNWKSTLKCFTVLHHCKTIFLNLEIFTGAILSLFFFPVGQAVLCNKKTQSNIFYGFWLFLFKNEIMDWIEGRISSTESDFGFIDGNVFFTQNACPG